MAIADELVAILGYELRGQENAKRYEQQLKNINKSVERLSRNVGRFATVAVAAFGFLGRSVTNTSAQFERYEAILTTLEGSSEKAKNSLDFLTEFASSTPFEIDKLTEAFVKLKSFGIDPIANDTFRILGDTAAAMGRDLDSAVEAFADAATGEFERIKAFGIKASTVGDQVTFRWAKNGKELSKTVKKNGEEIRSFLLENFGARFGGAMENLSKTYSNMLNNLGDEWINFKRLIGEFGFFADVKANLEKVLATIAQLKADGTLDIWAQNISNALSSVMYVFELLAQRIFENTKFLIENWESLEGPLTVIGFLLGALVVKAFPLVSLFAILAIAVDDFLSYLQGGESFIGDFIEKLQELLGVPESVAQAFTGLAGVVLSALTAAFLFSPGKVIKSFGLLLTKGIAGLAPLIVKAFGTAFALLSKSNRMGCNFGRCCGGFSLVLLG